AHVMLQCAHDDERSHDGPSPEPGAARQAAETDREGVFHMSTTRPSESSAAWATASDMVGWAWIASSTSSTVYSFSRATASSWMISEAFPHALVGEHGRPGHVADGVVAGRGGLQAGIDLDEAPLGDLDAALRQADVFGVDRAARRHEHGGDLELARRAVGLDLDRHLVLGGRSLLHLGAGDHLDAALLVALRQRVRCFGVLERPDPRQRLDQRDAGTERAENVGELHADGSRADDRQ